MAHDAETSLSRRWKKGAQSTTMTMAARDLKLQLDALERRCIQEMQGDAAVARAERQMLDLHARWCVEHDVVHTDDWRRPSLHRWKGGRYPYPGFSSLVHTSHLNATLQCLLHCSAALVAEDRAPSHRQGEGTDC